MKITRSAIIKLLEFITVGVICLLLSIVDFDIENPVAWLFLFKCIAVGAACGTAAYILKYPYKIMRIIYAVIMVLAAFAYKNLGVRGDVPKYSYKLYRRYRSYSYVYYTTIERYNRFYKVKE